MAAISWALLGSRLDGSATSSTKASPRPSAGSARTCWPRAGHLSAASWVPRSGSARSPDQARRLAHRDRRSRSVALDPRRRYGSARRAADGERLRSFPLAASPGEVDAALARPPDRGRPRQKASARPRAPGRGWRAGRATLLAVSAAAAGSASASVEECQDKLAILRANRRSGDVLHRPEEPQQLDREARRGLGEAHRGQERRRG
jgi:hypothetical protein